MYNIIISSSVGSIIGLLSGFAFTCYIVTYLENKEKDKPIDLLKNALLTFAITSVNRDDMADFDFNYANYNGKKYPPLSGSSMENACFSYIFNVKDLKKSSLYSENYARKMVAIQKYLDMNLGTDAQVVEFFHKVCEKYKENDTDVVDEPMNAVADKEE
jgi:hypothetical protein